jgi:hypothetical protein|tara:strand:- start:429 stop:998 length:570 start_codon:yes stop_codon:yes gene_type:complete
MRLIDKPLTEMQRKFARYHVEAKYGNQHLTNTECAIKAGYAPDSAYQRAYELLNPRISPHVTTYIGKMSEDFRIKHNIDPDKHMARLNFLGKEAEKNKMIGVALRAEELRGKVAGYYIDRQIIKNKGDDMENMSVEELEKSIQNLLLDWEHTLTPEAADLIRRKQKYDEEQNVQKKRKVISSDDTETNE